MKLSLVLSLLLVTLVVGRPHHHGSSEKSRSRSHESSEEKDHYLYDNVYDTETPIFVDNDYTGEDTTNYVIIEDYNEPASTNEPTPLDPNDTEDTSSFVDYYDTSSTNQPPTSDEPSTIETSADRESSQFNHFHGHDHNGHGNCDHDCSHDHNGHGNCIHDHDGSHDHNGHGNCDHDDNHDGNGHDHDHNGHGNYNGDNAIIPNPSVAVVVVQNVQPPKEKQGQERPCSNPFEDSHQIPLISELF